MNKQQNNNQRIIKRVDDRLHDQMYEGPSIVRPYSRLEWLIRAVQQWEKQAFEIMFCAGGSSGIFENVPPRDVSVELSMLEQKAWDEIDDCLAEML